MPSNNWAQWQKDNEIYFARKYEQYGVFFETLKPYKPEVPSKPKVPRRRVAYVAKGSKKGKADPSKKVAVAQETSSVSLKKGDDSNENDSVSNNKKSDDESNSNKDSDSNSNEDLESDYEDDADTEEEDIVATQEDAVYIYHKRLERVEKEKQQWSSYKPAMFADLLRSLGSEARALVEASSKFDGAKTAKDPVILLKICHKKLRHYSASRGIAKEVRSARSLYSIHQWATEHTSDYYQRFVREVEEFENYHIEQVTERTKVHYSLRGYTMQDMEV